MKKIISALGFLLILMFSSLHHVDAAGAGIIGPDVIHKEKNQIFTVIDLVKLYDQDVFIQEDNYTGNGNQTGTYDVILNQGDQVKTVQIIVIENWGNLEDSNDLLFVTNQKNIYLSSERELTLYEIVYYIYANTGLVETNYNFRYEEIENQYYISRNESGIIPAGTYTHDFKLTYYSGEQVTFRTLINVVELPEIPGVVLEPPPGVLDQIMGMVPLFLIIGVPIYLLTNHKKRKRGF